MSEEKILVVDDEIANLQKLQRTFVNRYTVLTASSGLEALDLARRNDAIAVMIVDQRMPDMTGVEFLRQTLLASDGAIDALNAPGEFYNVGRLESLHSDLCQFIGGAELTE